MFPMDVEDALAQKEIQFTATLGARAYADADQTTAFATLPD